MSGPPTNWRGVSMRKRHEEVVPSLPFAEWLNRRVSEHEADAARGYGPDEYGPIIRMCIELGWSPTDAAARRLYRMRYMISETSRGRKSRRGEKGVRVLGVADWYTRSVVEEALFHAGVPFGELYPEIVAAEDLVLEPEAWCPGCRESRSPINGQCPFCEWRLGPPTGQALLGRRLVA